MLAARELGDATKADLAWKNLYSDGRMSPARAFYLGDSLYAWGFPKEAEALLWAAADRPDLSYQALGTLARLYQMQRDAEGQYRAFAQLNAMRRTNRNIANNFAYFAALTNQGNIRQIEHIAEDNFAHEPGNIFYRSTYAFVLVRTGQVSRAMTVMEPVSGDWKKSRAIAWAYGSALASVGRKAEAREVFDSLDLGRLNTLETDWIRLALR
jgi:predicted Zn-dependent protease